MKQARIERDTIQDKIIARMPARREIKRDPDRMGKYISNVKIATKLCINSSRSDEQNERASKHRSHEGFTSDLPHRRVQKWSADNLNSLLLHVLCDPYVGFWIQATFLGPFCQVWTLSCTFMWLVRLVCALGWHFVRPIRQVQASGWTSKWPLR